MSRSYRMTHRMANDHVAGDAAKDHRTRKVNLRHVERGKMQGQSLKLLTIGSSLILEGQSGSSEPETRAHIDTRSESCMFVGTMLPPNR